jgi:radical SAM superfamily enzyme YgiQ (UPF0313 family)
MRLYLINPSNPLVSIAKPQENRWHGYTTWKPLGLLIVAALTPAEWEITVIDENLGIPDYAAMPRPDLVGITAFTSQAPRAYQVAAGFRSRGVPVVMGGIHATMCLSEALERVDAVVTGEAESVWAQVLEDARRGALNRVYAGTHLSMDQVPPARHDLLPTGYRLGSIQTTRGCPLNCSFCSVTAFNGGRFRHRPIGQVVQEFKLIREKYVLIVDDNLVGIRADHIDRAKALFRAMIQANLGKKWIAQATINMADDRELLELAANAGCCGVFIGLESPSVEGLAEVRKKFNIGKGRDLRASVRRIKRHGIPVFGAFIIGLDVDEPGIGRQIAVAADFYGVDGINVTFLTPLPGTRLWDEMEREGRIVANAFPEDWQYYTLSFPVAQYKHLSWTDMLDERDACFRAFYAYPRAMRRVFGNLWRMRRPFNTLLGILGNLSHNGRAARLYRERAQRLDLSRGSITSGL